MPTIPTSPPPRRRRRSPQAAVAEILGAAEALLAERPFREFTVDGVMARTTLSRSSFYVYFRDRYDLLLRLVGTIGAELQKMNELWSTTPTAGSEAQSSLLMALAGVVDTYETHGRVMRAIADAAAADPLVETLYDQLLARFVEVNAAHITEQQQAGLIPGELDAVETARALVWMTERFLVRSATTPKRTVSTLASVWTRTLYGS